MSPNKTQRPVPETGTNLPRPALMPWRFAGRLFPEISLETANALEGYGCLLRKAMPLRPKHFNELPYQIKALSQALTTDRGVGPPTGYLSEDKFLAAYVWYFLPWNIYRLTRLLSGLALDLPDGATVLDLGAGPLTFVQALWLARPELRSRRISFLCLDTSLKAMRLGADLFELLRAETAGAGIEGAGEGWRIQPVRGQLRKAPHAGADLVVAANVLNELNFSRVGTLADRMDIVAETLAESAGPTGRLLVIEPGVRSSAKMLARLRESFIEMGLSLLAPCPHDEKCPLDGGLNRSWCHFNAASVSAPEWLQELSTLATLPKSGVSLSFLLAAAPGAQRSKGLIRIVSNLFRPEGGPGPEARYGCFAEGLGLILANERTELASGDLVDGIWPEKTALDAKTGAIKVMLGRNAEKNRIPAAENPPQIQAKSCPAPGGIPGSPVKRGRSVTRQGGPGGPGGRGRSGKPGGQGRSRGLGGQGRSAARGAADRRPAKKRTKP